MRKWLNIKPKVHEFSEDEVDPESEDDGLVNQPFLRLMVVSRQLCGLKLILLYFLCYLVLDVRGTGVDPSSATVRNESTNSSQATGIGEN